MAAPVDDEELQARFNEARNLDEFLSSVNRDAKENLETVFTHEGEDDKGAVTIVGGVHGGSETVEGVKNVIDARQPDHVAVELGPIQYFLVKLFKPPSSTLELAVGIFEAELHGAETHPIDRSRFWMRLMEILHGPLPTRMYALATLAKYAIAVAVVVLALAFLALGNPIIGFAFSFIAGILLWRLGCRFRRDPHREYDYALITIITNVAEKQNQCPITERLTRKRDSHMAEQIKRLRCRGDVVAIVGYNHVRGIRNRIDSDDDNWQTSNFELDGE